MNDNGKSNGRVVLTREQFREAARNVKIKREPLYVEELGGDIYVRGMSGKEKDKLEEKWRIKKGRKAGQLDLSNYRAARVCRVVVDEQGNPLLNDQDIDWVGDLPSGVHDRIINKCEELSGSDAEEADDLKKDSAKTEAGAASSSI